VTLQLLPSIIYLAAQVIAIKVTFNSIFELDPDASYPVIIIMAMILVFEWLGGAQLCCINGPVSSCSNGSIFHHLALGCP
jgi:Na+/proline symporter